MLNRIVSKYVVLFEYNNTYLLFNSKNNSFLELNEDLYRDLLACQKGEETFLFDDVEMTRTLEENGILTTELEDQNFLDELILKHNLVFYSSENVQLTLVPTISCNLRCPYCFETNKPTGIITEEICDRIISFLKSHEKSSSLNLTWFGGEPLLAIKKMGYFLDRLHKNEVKLNHHSIVTNATLLKGMALDVFEKYPLDNIQVTLDGKKENHDKLRIRPDGSGTYDEILQNLDGFVVRFPKTSVSIRINVGTHNSDDFFDLKESLLKRYSNQENIYVYPGILEGDNDCGYLSNFFSPKELSAFHALQLKNEDKIEFPTMALKACVANLINGYVIGPQGEIYKCWEDIGFKDRDVGSVTDNKFRNSTLFKRYMLHSSFLDDKKCHDCSLLSICSGGCSRHRIENKYEGKNWNLCDHYMLEDKHTLKKRLYLYYLQQKERL